MSAKMRPILACLVVAGSTGGAIVASGPDVPVGPKCRVVCGVFEIHAGDVSYALHADSSIYRLKKGGGGSSGLEQIGANARKDEFSVKLHGANFPFKADVKYKRTAKGKTVVEIGQDNVTIVREKFPTLIASEDGKRVLVLIFEVIPED